ncbi:MAG TPA: hypothetical protein VJ734_06010 [Nitrosospira sp.]|nr:hypothetical protein [Nitrosospira sp.]
MSKNVQERLAIRGVVCLESRIFAAKRGEWSRELLLPMANEGKRKVDHEDMKLDALQK